MTAEEWLGENNEVGQSICLKKYKQASETVDEMIKRVSGNNPEVARLIRELKYLPGGRIMSNRGTGKKASFSNCYSRGYVEDDFAKILDVAKEIGLTFKAQGGQGISLSKVRPKGCKVSKEFQSDGILPFMEIYNTVTSSTSQGGARKGALLISLDCMHKDIKDFVTAKSGTGKFEKANLSVEVNDEFMSAVKNFYDTGEIVQITITRIYGGEKIEYTITPIEIYHLMMRQAYDYAEPGVIYTERFRNYNLMECCDDYEVETGNPCGEQPLPKHGACCLGSINLSEFVLDPFTKDACYDVAALQNAVKVAIRSLNEIVDEGIPLHALKEQRDMAREYRNIGLGEMGLADTFIKMGIKYGSDYSKNFTELIGKAMFRAAVKASYELAKEHGAFPKYRQNLFDSKIMRANFSEQEIAEMKPIGLRNCSLLSIAPTGSIGTMLNISTGIEPIFAFKYQRKTESLHKDKEKTYDVYAGIAQQFFKVTGEKNLPDYFVTSADIHWKDRVDVQAAFQKYIDTAISSTVNLPNNIPLKEMEQLYLYAWEQGLKGITVYRDGCSLAGILTTSKPASKHNEDDIIFDSITPVSRKKLGTTHGDTFCQKCACGTLYLTINRNESGDIVECFVHTSKGGICQANIGAVNRMASLAMRSGVKIEEISDQLKGINCPACVQVKTKGERIDGLSCPDIIAKTLLKFYNQNKQNNQGETKPRDDGAPRCPECNNVIHREGGCVTCQSCGWSKCE